MLFLDMPRAEQAALVRRTLDPDTPKSKERRAAIADRVACVEERPEVLARARIRQIFVDQTIASHVCRFASSVWNPLMNICSRVAQGYAHPPIRRIPDDPEAEAQLLAFLEGPTRFDTRAKGWNLLSVALSTIVVLVVPRNRREKGCFDFRVVNGAASEVVLDPMAPFGDTPEMLAYCIQRREDRYTQKPGEPVVCVVDAYAYHYCDAQGGVVKSEPHGLTRFPGAVLRSCEPDGSDADDWWAWRKGHTLVAATATVGAIGAICEWARKTQWGKLVTVSRTGEESEDPAAEEGQTIGAPESLLEVIGADIKVEDFEAKVEGFIKHQAAILHEASRRTTGSSRILDDQLLSAEELAQRHAVLLGLQRDQHGYLGPFERDLLEVMAEQAEVFSIEDFPTVEQLDSYEVQFVPLTYVATPEARLKYFVEASKFGVSDQVQFLQEQGWSERDAREHLKRIAERRAELHEIQAERNSPADPLSLPALIRGLHPGALAEMGTVTTSAQPGERPEALTGRAGGIQSASVKAIRGMNQP